MPFVADSHSLKTFDAQRGYELLTAGGGSDGYSFFEIRREDGISIRFENRYDKELVETWVRAHPEAVKPSVRFVTASRGCFPDLSRNETDEIIREALEAFKGVHGRPIGSDVVVFFENADGEIR